MENFNQEDKIQALELSLELLKAGDQSFAASLIKSGKRYTLSDKQAKWVDILLDRALGKGEKPEEVQVGSMAGLIALFNKAKAALKSPKLYLQVGSVPVVVSVAGKASKAPGTINVAGKGAFNERPWYGRVTEEGTWQKGFKKYDESRDVEKLLVALADNPAKAAKEYGKLSGQCCFCGKGLTDEKSTSAGFGPVCAEKWGLKDAWNSAQGVLS